MSDFPIQIDATALIYLAFVIPGVSGWIATKQPSTLNLSPGTYGFQVGSGEAQAFSFQVSEQGTVNFDAQYDGICQGRNSKTLTVTGLPVSFNVSALLGSTVYFANQLAPPITTGILRLLPNRHGIIFGSAQVTPLAITVTLNGRVEYDPALDQSVGGCLKGLNTAALTMLGYSLVIDARGSGAAVLVVANIAASAPTLVMEARLLPYESYRFILQSGVVTNAAAHLTIAPNGKMALSPLLAKFATLDTAARVPVLRFWCVPPPVAEPTPVTLHSEVFCDVTLLGAILLRWQALGNVPFDRDRSVQRNLGRALGPAEGSAQYFERGMLYAFDPSAPLANPGSNDWLTNVAVVMLGDLYGYYVRHGAHRGSLGFPVEDARVLPDGGLMQKLTNCQLISTEQGGVHALSHQLAEMYRTALNDPNRPFGVPIGDTYRVAAPDVPAHPTAPATEQTTAYDITRLSRAVVVEPITASGNPQQLYQVTGDFLDKWNDAGYVTGPLGAPRSNTVTTSKGTEYQDFTGGTIVRLPTAGAKSIVVTSLELYLERCEVDQTRTGWLGLWHVDLYLQMIRYKNGVPIDNLDDPYKLPDDHDNYGLGDSINFTALTLDLVSSADTVGLHLHGRDHFNHASDNDLGDIDATFDVDNAWGLDPSYDWTHTSSDSVFQVQFGMRRPAQAWDPATPWRKFFFWGYHNFNTPELSHLQCADTFTDIGADDQWWRHPFNSLFYSLIYKGLAAPGNCYGMCQASIDIQLGRGERNEPVWDSDEANDLDQQKNHTTPNAPSIVNDINVAHGYQISPDSVRYFITHVLGGSLLGAGIGIASGVPGGAVLGAVIGTTSNAKKTFYDSKAQFLSGDWPIINILKNRFTTDGHAVRPYNWDDSNADGTGNLYIRVANPNTPYVPQVGEKDPHDPTKPKIPPDPTYGDDDPTCRIVITPDDTWHLDFAYGQTWSGGWIWSVPRHLVDSKGDSLAGDLELLTLALAGGLIFVLGAGSQTAQVSGGGASYFTVDGQGNVTGLSPQPPAGLGLIPLVAGVTDPRPELWCLCSDSVSDLSFAVRGSGAGTLSCGLRTIPGAFTFACDLADGVTDMISVENIGQDGQSVRYTAGPGQLAKQLAVTVEAYRGNQYSRTYTVAPGQVLTFTLTNCGTQLNDRI